MCTFSLGCFLILTPAEANTIFISDILNLHSNGLNIICLGDSLTFGKGSTPGHDYPSLLSKAIGIPVINAGVNDDETEDALKRLDRDVLSKNPRLVIVLLGANDYLDRKPLSEAFQNLDEIVRRIQESGSMVALVEIGASYLGSDVEDGYLDIVHRRQAALIPHIYEGIWFNPRLKSDLLHPNDEGYQIMADRIIKVVQPLVQQNQTGRS